MMAVRAELINARFSYENPSNQPLKDLSSDLTLDLVAVVPSQVSYIIQNIGNLPKIKNLLIGGSAIHPELRKKIVNSGLNAYESYGMTETASHIALRKIEAFEKPFSVFPDISLSLDEDNCLVIHFEEGIIIKTNDIAEMVSETEFYIKGRRDQIIISGGRKINPMELEKIFSEFIHVSFLLTGFPDEKWGEKLVLIIEAEKNETLVSQLRDKLMPKCRKWEIPKEIIFVDSLPRTPNGKIKRIKDPSFLSFSAHDKDLSF